jgi:hypothetical protein
LPEHKLALRLHDESQFTVKCALLPVSRGFDEPANTVRQEDSSKIQAMPGNKRHSSPREWGPGHTLLVPFHAAVLELQGTGGTNGFRQRLVPRPFGRAHLVQAME